MTDTEFDSKPDVSEKPSASTIVKVQNADKHFGLGGKKHWQISVHCSSILFPTSYPDISFNTSSANFYFRRYCADTVPDKELVREARQAYFKVLNRLNQNQLQVKTFILPVQLIKLKYIDPYSRQRIMEGMCRYLSSQTQLRNVVLEQAGVKFADLCNLLMSVGRNSLVKKLYLWNVLDKCDVPFRGPLQSKVNLDELPRLPYTYNPGGRKYLRLLEKTKQDAHNIKQRQEEESTTQKAVTDADVLTSTAWIEKLVEECFKSLENSDGPCTAASFSDLMDKLFESIDQRDFVFTQMDVGTQCGLSQNSLCDIFCHIPKRAFDVTYPSQTLATLDDLLTKAKVDCCKQFLKLYENNYIKIETLRKMYIIALNGLINLTTLSINYSLLADGTGDALLSIGSVSRGKLKDLELLCQLEDLPSLAHQQYDHDALHNIPDITWSRVKESCPELKVHVICLGMQNNEISKRFMSTSIPLNSIHFSNNFCPTLLSPQLMFFKTLTYLTDHFKDTLEHVDIVLWHASGRIDNSLFNLLKNAIHLRSFEYRGPLQYKKSVDRLCNCALQFCSKLVCFKLIVEGDPCFPNVAKDLTKKLYLKYLPKFYERSIQFMLGTHCS